MKTFKSFLNEATSVNLSTFNVTKFTLDDIIQCYENAGYEVSARDRKLYEDSKYMGPSSSGPKFAVLLHNDDEEGGYISMFFISIGKSGMLEAETAGRPSFENDDFDVVQEKFDNITEK